MLQTIFFLFLLKESVLASFSESSLNSNDLEYQWYNQYSKFRQLKGLNEKNLKKLLKNQLIREELKNFKQINWKFFSVKPKEAFTALENFSNDFGLLLFFLRSINNDIINDLMTYSKIYFSFDEFLREDLEPRKHILVETIRMAIFHISLGPKNEVLKIILRIFEKLASKIKEKIEIAPLEEAIQTWKYEITEFDKKSEIIPLQKDLNQEYDILQKNLCESSKEIPLHIDLVECFYRLKVLVESETPSKPLKRFFRDKFANLAFIFVMDSCDFSFLLRQRIEFIIILVNCFFDIDYSKKIKLYFKKIFLNPKENTEKIKLALTAQEKLKDLVDFSRETALGNVSPELSKKLAIWGSYKCSVILNSIKCRNSVVKIFKKLSQFIQTSN